MIIKYILPWVVSFRFAAWWFLPLLLLVPLWSWLRGRYARAAALQFSSGDLVRPASRQTRFKRGQWLAALRYLALTILILGLARPQVEKGFTDVDKKGINIMLVLDFSGTMQSRDFTIEGKKVTRSKALVKVIGEFMRSRKNDKIGVVRYDMHAFLVSPLTLDHEWLVQRLDKEENGQGTAPGAGMLIGAEHLLAVTNQARVMIVVTDAANLNAGENPVSVAQALAPLGIRVHVVQIIDFANMARGVSAGPMGEVPKITGGQLFQVADYSGLRNVYRQIDKLEKAKFKEGRQRMYLELMPWFVALALAIVLFELIMGETVWRRVP